MIIFDGKRTGDDMRTRNLKWVMALVAVIVVTISARADDLQITSFGGNGELVFNEISNAVNYRVEWAPKPGGPWYSFEGSGLLNGIVATGTGSITSSVPMFYRMVAVTNASPPRSRNMVPIPGGTNSGTDDYGAYSLIVSAFYMDATEVTKAQWDDVYSWAVMHDYSFDNAGSGKGWNHPVEMVNWYDCVKWCNARSEKDGRTPCYTVSENVYTNGNYSPVCDFSANGYRLPTSDEWEYAARGGLSGKRFPWGDTINHNNANYEANGSAYSYDTSPYTSYTFHPDYDDSGYPYTSPVGDFSANGYGLYDMAGNVWEWCNDASGSYRFIRGGCWRYDADYLRCGLEVWSPPDGSDYYIGFRSACR
jgi:formylglycine-generating enzyme required for sulfatase activity